MASQDRVQIFVDGSNLYHRLRECIPSRNLLQFQYGAFVHWIVGARELAGKTYYIGVVRAAPDDARAQALRRDQQRLFAALSRGGWGISRGFILRSDGGFHEKGVDVQMAVDLLAGAYEDRYDVAVLVSSDTDLIPALTKVRAMKKKVEYIGFSHKPSLGLITNSDIRRLLTADDLTPFVSGQ
jgi:uncharacterized LabA/DUF88 family protein